MAEIPSIPEIRRDELRTGFSSARENLLKQIVSINSIDAKKEVGVGRSVKDVVAHIVEWDKQIIADAQVLLSGDELDMGHYDDVDDFNRGVQRLHQESSYEKVRDELIHTTFVVSVFFLGANSDELFTYRDQEYKGDNVTIAWLLKDLAMHDIEHLKEIQETLGE